MTKRLLYPGDTVEMTHTRGEHSLTFTATLIGEGGRLYAMYRTGQARLSVVVGPPNEKYDDPAWTTRLIPGVEPTLLGSRAIDADGHIYQRVSKEGSLLNWRRLDYTTEELVDDELAPRLYRWGSLKSPSPLQPGATGRLCEVTE